MIDRNKFLEAIRTNNIKINDKEKKIIEKYIEKKIKRINNLLNIDVKNTEIIYNFYWQEGEFIDDKKNIFIYDDFLLNSNYTEEEFFKIPNII